MTRQLEQQWEDRRDREQKATLQAVYGGIEEGVKQAGGELMGLSLKLSGGDCLVTLRAIFEGESQIAFVGAEDMPSAMRKVVREIYRDQLSWRSDQYAEKQG